MFNESIHQLFCSSRLSAAIDVLRRLSACGLLKGLTRPGEKTRLSSLLMKCFTNLFILLMSFAPVIAWAVYPDATNTGVPPGTVLTPSGSITVTVAGTVLDALDISGRVIIDANNVTLKNSRIRTSAFEHIIKIRKGRTGAVIQDCEIDGMGGRAGSDGITGRATVLRVNIHGVQEGYLIANNSLIMDSYIHDLAAPGSGNFVGVGQDSSQHQKIMHNSIIMDLDQMTAVRINKNTAGNPAPDIEVHDNRLIGGNYTVVCDGTGKPTFTNVSFTNNRLGMELSGYKQIINCTPAWSGNFDDITGNPVN